MVQSSGGSALHFSAVLCNTAVGQRAPGEAVRGVVLPQASVWAEHCDNCWNNTFILRRNGKKEIVSYGNLDEISVLVQSNSAHIECPTRVTLMLDA